MFGINLGGYCENKEKQVYVRHYLFVSITIYPKMLVLYHIGAFILPDKNFKWVFSINMQHSYKSVSKLCTLNCHIQCMCTQSLQ